MHSTITSNNKENTENKIFYYNFIHSKTNLCLTYRVVISSRRFDSTKLCKLLDFICLQNKAEFMTICVYYGMNKLHRCIIKQYFNLNLYLSLFYCCYWHALYVSHFCEHLIIKHCSYKTKIFSKYNFSF